MVFGMYRRARAEEITERISRLAVYSRRFHSKSNAEMREILNQCRDSFCYRFRECFGFELPLRYYAARYEIRQRKIKKE